MTPEVVGRMALVVGCLLAGLAVAAGAFGAHMLKEVLEPSMLAAYDTAARYQMYHAMAMVLVGLAISITRDQRLSTVAWLFAAGIVMFCGSLYGIALLGIRWLGPITPVGGLSFMAGWGLFAWRIWTGFDGRVK